jgi:hypothetical protein
MRWWGCPLCTRLTAQLDFHSGSSLKQQSADRHFAPLGHIENHHGTTNYSESCYFGTEINVWQQNKQ